MPKVYAISHQSVPEHMLKDLQKKIRNLINYIHPEVLSWSKTHQYIDRNYNPNTMKHVGSKLISFPLKNPLDDRLVFIDLTIHLCECS